MLQEALGAATGRWFQGLEEASAYAGQLSMEVGVPPTMAAVAPNKDKDNTPLDEQLARELHAQLNDPQNAPPLTRRRTRKAPSFYTPQVRPCA